MYLHFVNYTHAFKASCARHVPRLTKKELHIKAIRFAGVYPPLFIHYVPKSPCRSFVGSRLCMHENGVSGGSTHTVAPSSHSPVNWIFKCDFKCECKSLNLKLDFLAFCTLVDLFHLSFRCFVVRVLSSSSCTFPLILVQLIYGFDSIVYTKNGRRVFFSFAFSCRSAVRCASKSPSERWAHACEWVGASEDELSRVWKRQPNTKKFHE